MQKLLKMNFDQISPRSMEYLAKVDETPEDQFEEITLGFIGDREASGLVVPDFDASCEWLNTFERLSFETNLKDKLCVMDFFTYCCINCMHVLPRKLVSILVYFLFLLPNVFQCLCTYTFSISLIPLLSDILSKRLLFMLLLLLLLLMS